MSLTRGTDKNQILQKHQPGVPIIERRLLGLFGYLNLFLVAGGIAFGTLTWAGNKLLASQEHSVYHQKLEIGNLADIRDTLDVVMKDIAMLREMGMNNWMQMRSIQDKSETLANELTVKIKELNKFGHKSLMQDICGDIANNLESNSLRFEKRTADRLDLIAKLWDKFERDFRDKMLIAFKPDLS